MAGLFLSHSSKDKLFVVKMAIDLLNQNFPVWLDKWNMETGDSLLGKIKAGLDASFFLIIIISKDSVNSEWVTKELNAALIKEEKIGRKFIIPIIINDCSIPEILADRLYLDFRNNYLGNFQRLIKLLKGWKVDKIKLAENENLIPLKILKLVDLDKQSIINRVAKLNLIGKHNQILEKQIIFEPAPIFTALKSLFLARVENLETDPFYSSDFTESIMYNKNKFDELEDKLINGVCSIINNHAKINITILNDSLYWYCKIILTRMYYLLWNVQNPNGENLINFEDSIKDIFNSSSLSSNHPAALFFECESVARCVIGEGDWFIKGKYFSFWLDEESKIYKELKKNIGICLKFKEVIHSEDVAKFIVPQMLADYTEDFHLWNLNDMLIGIS
jgi:hypothetical protein